jgi:hypothetical protein
MRQGKITKKEQAIGLKNRLFKIFGKRPEKKDHFQIFGVVWWVITKWILKKRYTSTWAKPATSLLRYKRQCDRVDSE